MSRFNVSHYSHDETADWKALLDPIPREQRTGDFSPRDIDPGMAIPAVFGFNALIQGNSRTFFREWYDEAMRHRRRDAVAMEHDEHIQACLEERYRGVLKIDWHLEGDNTKDPVQKAVADGVTRIIKSIHRLKRLKYGLLQAIWPGRAGVQVEWERKQMQLPAMPVMGLPAGMGNTPTKALCVRRFHLVNGDKIGYTWDHCPMVRIAGQAQDDFRKIGADVVSDMMGFSVVLRGSWRDRWLIHTSRPKDPDFDEPEAADAIHGKGVRDVVFWSWFLRQNARTNILDALDRYGLGCIAIYYTSGNAQEKEEADRQAKKWSRRTVVTIPRAADSRQAQGIEVIEAPTAGIQILLNMVEHYERLEERYLIGQSMSSGSDAEGSLGGSGRADFARGTKHDIIVGDAEDLDETLTGSDLEPGLVGMIQKHTYPWSWDMFRLRHVTAVPDPESFEKLAAVEKAYGMGVDFAADGVRSLTGLGKPEEGEEILSLSQQNMQQAMLGMPPQEEPQEEEEPQEDSLDPGFKAIFGGEPSKNGVANGFQSIIA